MATSLYLWQQKPAGSAMHIAHVQFCPAVYQQCLHVPNILFPHKTLEIRIGSLQSRDTSMMSLKMDTGTYMVQVRHLVD